MVYQFVALGFLEVKEGVFSFSIRRCIYHYSALGVDNLLE